MEVFLLGEAVGGGVSASDALISIAGVKTGEEIAVEVELKHGRKRERWRPERGVASG